MRRLALFLLLGAGLLDTAGAVERGDVPPNALGKESRSGEAIRVDAHAGKVMVISFWASWCGPCRQELPVLEALQRKVPTTRLRVVAINYQEEAEVYAAHLEKMKDMRLSLVHDRSGDLAEAFGVEALPNLFLIDHRGRVAHVHLGYDTDQLSEIVGEINALLKAQAQAKRALPANAAPGV